MSYKTYKVLKKGDFSYHDIIFEKEFSEYLESIESNVFLAWEKRFKAKNWDMSLAKTYQNDIIKKLKALKPTIDGVKCDIVYISGNYGTIDKFIFQILNKSLQGEKKFLAVTMTQNHAKFYNYDDTQIYIGSLEEKFQQTFEIIKEEYIPDVYILCLGAYKGLKYQIKYPDDIENVDEYLYLEKLK